MSRSSSVVNSSGFRRYLTTSDGSASFTYSANGVFAAAPGSPHPIFPLSASLALMIIPFGDLSTGADANGATFDYRVWAIHSLMAASSFDLSDTKDVRQGQTSSQLLRTYLGGGSVTLGTQTGAAGGAIAATEHFADTLSWTPSGVATTPVGPLVVAETAFNEGTSGAYQATTPENTHTMIFIPHILRATGIIIDFDSTSANSRGNFLILSRDI